MSPEEIGMKNLIKKKQSKWWQIFAEIEDVYYGVIDESNKIFKIECNTLSTALPKVVRSYENDISDRLFNTDA